MRASAYTIYGRGGGAERGGGHLCFGSHLLERLLLLYRTQKTATILGHLSGAMEWRVILAWPSPLATVSGE